jgi:tetratricopeptide (TPR) repeat protein
VVGVIAGCATNDSGSTRIQSSSKMFDERSAEQRVEEASHLATGGESTTAIPRLLQVISQYPDTRAALEARYWLGITYYNIKSYLDSLQVFDEYLKLAPKGERAAEVQNYVQRISAEYNEKFPGPGKMDARIKELTTLLRADSSVLAYQWELADLLWKRGDFDSSARVYLYIVDKHPEYANDATVSSRIERLPSGGYITLSPAEVQRREVKDHPLEIVNETSFRSGPDLLTREKRFYVVTGQVVNRSDSVMYGVDVTVTIYGFGSVVYDTRSVSIGRLNAGETRAFSTRFSNFENIENIDRFECVGTFQR